jgi:hypothetical protein
VEAKNGATRTLRQPSRLELTAHRLWPVLSPYGMLSTMPEAKRRAALLAAFPDTPRRRSAPNRRTATRTRGCAFIDDLEVTIAFEAIERWYA